jgi:hypothetical protein
VVPLAQQEVPNSIANLHWPALYVLFWALIWVPARRAGTATALAVVALTALSDILVVGFLPLAAARLVLRRDRTSGWLAGVLTGGVAVQVAGLVFGSNSRTTSPDPLSWPVWYAVRAVPAALFGERLAPFGSIDARRVAVAAVAWVLLLAAVVAATRGWSRPRWPLAMTAAVYSVAIYALPVVISGIATPRYAAAPAMLLVTALVAVLQPAPGRRAIAFGAFATMMLFVWLVNFQVTTAREQGPMWSDELDRARATCQTAGGGSAEVQFAPAGSGLVAPLSCSWVAGSR